MTIIKQAPPPSSYDAEYVLLAGLMTEGAYQTEGEPPSKTARGALRLLSADDFSKGSHGDIWQAMLDLAERGLPLEPIAIRARVNQLGGDDSAIDDLEAGTDSIWNGVGRVELNARRVKQAAQMRRVYYAAMEAQERARKLDPAAISVLASAIESIQETGERVPEITDEEWRDAAKDLLQPPRLDDDEGNLSWGVRELDTQGSFLRPTDFAILAGRPGTGKTTLALGWAIRWAKTIGKPVIYCSLEMPQREMLIKALSHESGVPTTGRRRPSDEAAVDEVIRHFQKSVPLLLPARIPRTLEDFIPWAHGLAIQHKPAIMVVDYLGLLGAKGGTLYEKTSETSKALRGLAMESGVPVLALAQMNREIERESRVPRSSDLRDSGQIEQDATHILFLFKNQKRDLMLACTKARGGSSGQIVTMTTQLNASRIAPRYF